MKNIIKILVFLISVVTYAQVQPVNYYQQFNKVNKADENDSIQVLVRTVGNPDHNIMKYVSASDIGGGSGGDGKTEIPDWQSQSYSQGDIVAHNGGIWRSNTDDNEDEPVPVECENNSWETYENQSLKTDYYFGSADGNGFGLESLILNSEGTSFNISTAGSFPIDTFIPSGSYVLSILMDGGGILGYTTQDFNIGDSIIDLSDNIQNNNGDYFYIPSLMPPSPCEDEINNYSNTIGADETTIYVLTSCPITDFPEGESSCTWTLLSQINEGGDLMTVNSENLITSDWSLITDQEMKLRFEDWGTLRIFEKNNPIVFSELALSHIRLENPDPLNYGQYYATIRASMLDSNVVLDFPSSESVPILSKYIPVSVNGEFADKYGNIEIEAGEQQFVQITEGSNTGYGLKYRADNPNRYGDIGQNAIDLGYSPSSSTTRGATGQSSTVSGGEYNTASNNSSTVSGGFTNTASGQFSTVSGGRNNTANSFGEWVGGIYGTIPTGQNATSWVATDRLFNIGNGTNTNASSRSDAFTILKNGLATLPSVTNTLIDAEPTGKAIATKEWVLANSGGSTPTLSEVLAEGNVANKEIKFDPMTFLYSDIHPYNFLLDYESLPDGSASKVEYISGKQIFYKIDPIEYYENGFNLSEGHFSSIITKKDFYSNETVNHSDFTHSIDYLFNSNRYGSLFVGEESSLGTFKNNEFIFNSGIIFNDVNKPTGTTIIIGNSIKAFSNENTLQTIFYPTEPEDIVTKIYVDDNFLPLPTEGTSGQVLTTDGAGSYTWEDVEVQTYLQSITGYDAGETQTLKHVNGVLQWVTD